MIRVTHFGLFPFIIKLLTEITLSPIFVFGREASSGRVRAGRVYEHPPKSTRPLKPLAVTVAQACELTGLGETTIYELLKNGTLRSVHVGKRRLIVYESVEELIEQGAPTTALPAPRRPGRPRNKVAATERTSPGSA